MAQEKVSKVSILTNGIIKENPVLRLVLGTCSTLAVTTAVSNAIGMGVAFTFVLVCSNIMIALLRNVIPAKVHLPCYIVIIAADRRQLYHSGPCRDVCLQEHRRGFCTGRHRHGHRLHPDRRPDGHHP